MAPKIQTENSLANGLTHHPHQRNEWPPGSVPGCFERLQRWSEVMDIDLTFILQFATFVLVLGVLNPLLFKPFQRVLEQRDEKTRVTHERAVSLRESAQADRQAYELRIDEARRAAHRERETLRDEGRGQEREILAEARSGVSTKLAAAREEIQTVESAASGDLAVQTEELSRLVAEKVLGRKLA